uniref:Uncharacterized protein n=1 Tax=Physcomitrium patens TaxID=3218 RepID=A0A2K1KUY9_PHYPA|nr:hypothetical protein PHYPA_004598 [Physcomitrium patens]
MMASWTERGVRGWVGESQCVLYEKQRGRFRAASDLEALALTS